MSHGIACLDRGVRFTVTRVSMDTDVDLPARAAGLFELLDEQAAAGDQQGQLTEPVVEGLHETGMFGIWVPRALGGFELGPLPSLEVIAQLTYGDPSTGWVLMATALATGTGGAYLGDAAVEQLFAGERFPVIAGQGTRPGTAVEQNGGFVLSGAWSFGSGIRHADYAHSLGVVEGTGEPRIFVTPIATATLIDNWDVLGLRATGSIDYTMDGVFVPHDFTHYALSASAERGGPVYRIGVFGFAMICHTGWALGLGRRLLDELLALVQQKAGRPGAIAESESFQGALAQAEAKYRAARALALETWSELQETLDRGDAPSVRQHTLIRLALNHITWTVHEISLFAYTSGGTTALRASTLQRLFRDMHAGTQHATSGQAVLQACGRELAGLAEGRAWRFLELVEGA
jgi:alkylation response protein AidB-like acyl-CoA dehydrogenase